MTAKKLHRWTAISVPLFRKNNRPACLCRCDCGTEKIMVWSIITAGQSKSCGCYNREQSSKKHKTHGLSLTPIYTVWKNMRARCERPYSVDYYLYGGRGIKVCERWHTFQNFFDDMGDIPFPLAQIDRIDCDGNYELSNCRWTTATENMRNRRINNYITFEGETHCITEWEEMKGLSRDRIATRLKAGWDLDKAMNTPIKKTGIAAREGFRYADTQHKWASNVAT